MLKLTVFLSLLVLAFNAPHPDSLNNPNFHDPMEAGFFEGDIAGVDYTKGLGHIEDLRYILWPGDSTAKAIVPYSLPTGEYSSYELDVIKRGLKHLEDMTRVNDRDCIRFVERTNQLSYLAVQRGSGCWSYVGRQRLGGKQDLSLGYGCLYTMTVAHEFMHALGIWHEQSRPDRDNFVIVDLTYVDSSNHHNFEKKTSGVTLCGTDYDLTSVMHYHETSFASQGKSIVAKDGTPLLATWDKDSISKTDVECIRNLYNCK